MHGIYIALKLCMLKYVKIYIISLFVALVFGAGFVNAGTQNREIFLLELVNQIRSAPFEYGVRLGYDPVFLEGLNIFPDTKFESYQMDEDLNFRAEASNNQMGTGDVESSEPEPIHSLTAETGGIVSFKNFIPANTAVEIIVNNLFKREVENNNFQHILSDKYLYIGVAVDSGVSQDLKNSWFITIRFGSALLKSETQILNLINQVRSEPWKSFSYIDKDLWDFVQENPGLTGLFSIHYTPVFFDSSLHAVAGDRSYYAFNINKKDVSDSLFVTMTLSERGIYHGYKGQVVQETGFWSVFDKGGFLVDELFSYLISREFSRWPYESTVFTSDIRQAGPQITMDYGEEEDFAFFSLATGYDVNLNSGLTAKIYGILFSDNDGNTIYSPGEEMAQQTVTVYDKDLQIVNEVSTDNAGHFSLTLDPNQQYIFKAVLETGEVTQTHFISEDQFVKLAYVTP